MLPFLPPEIILNVIRLGLPPASYSSYRERYDLLLVLTLVNRTWRSLAQRELFEDAVLDSNHGLERLSFALNSTAADLGSKIQSIRLRGGYRNEGHDWEALSTPAFWRSVSGVVEVQARNMILRLDHLAEMRSLRRLHLYKVFIQGHPAGSSSPVTPLFGHLQHLSICEYGRNPEGWMDLLCPSVFPALRSFLIARTVDFVIPVNMPNVLAAIGAQVTTLAVIDESKEQNLLRAMALCWGSFTALEHLVIHGRIVIHLSRPDLFTLLPTSLQSLEIMTSSFNPTAVLNSTLLRLFLALEGDLPNLRALKCISIPPAVSPVWTSYHGPGIELKEQRLAAVIALALSRHHRAMLKSLADARHFVLDETGTHRDRASAVWFSAWNDLSMAS